MRHLFFVIYIACTILSGCVSSDAAVGDANDTSKYIAVDGTDQRDCSGGSEANPWRSLARQHKFGCIAPGTTVYFLPGQYQANSEIFDGRLNVHGTTDMPITIAAAPHPNLSWPVQIIGAIRISHASNLVVRGIDFVRDEPGQDILSIGASHITITNSRIRGRENDYNSHRVGPGDCIKIAGGPKDVVNVRILNSEIFECPQDAVDITGRRKIIVRGNNIHDAWIFQIKGGADEILIEDNRLFDMRYGLSGNGMDCRKLSIYCGSPKLPDLPVEARFQARNVLVKNNTFRNISHGRAVDFSGWVDSRIIGNKIDQTTVGRGPVFSANHKVESVFADLNAKQFCAENPDRCSACRFADGSRCWGIRLPAQNVQIVNNEVRGDHITFIHFKPRAVRSPGTVCALDNIVRQSTKNIHFDMRKLSTNSLIEWQKCR